MSVALYNKTANSTHDQLVAQYAPMVRRVANQLAARLPASVDVDDLIQAGMIGLLDSIERFEAGHGAQFETFATQRVRGAMLDELRGADWVPRSVRKKQREVETAVSRLESKLLRAPTDSEIAAQMGLNLEQYHEVLSESRGAQLVYVDEFNDDDEGSERFLNQHVKEESTGPMQMLRDERFRADLVRQIDSLPEREKLMMSLYYEQELNLKEIGAVMGVSESRVCQLHGQAIARLRANLTDWL